MYKNIIYLFLQIFLIFELVTSDTVRFDGADCYHDGTRKEGVCVYIKYCEMAKEQFANGEDPELCRFEDNFPIVCCPLENPGIINKFSEVVEENCRKYGEMSRNLIQEDSEDYLEEEDDEGLGTTDRIINGTAASLGQFPHFASLGYEKLGEILWSCGGSLISPTFVLTAAHCQLPGNIPKFVRFGAIHQNSKNFKTYRVKRIINHPDYKYPSVYNDIGLVELDRPVKFSNTIRPACLPSSTEFDDRDPLAVCGFGITGFQSFASEVLLYVILHPFPVVECRKLIGVRRDRYDFGVQEDSQLCYGSRNTNKDSCYGDSGGPLSFLDTSVHLHRVVGIVSIGIGCGKRGVPGIYTRVSKYVPWIHEVVWGDN